MRNVIGKGYQSNEEPLKVQLLTHGLSRGDMLGDFQCGWELGMCKALAALGICEAVLCQVSRELLLDTKDTLVGLRYMAANYDSAANYEQLVSPRFSSDLSFWGVGSVAPLLSFQ